MRLKNKINKKTVLRFFVLLVLAFIFITPVAVMLETALRDSKTGTFTLENFSRAVTQIPFIRYQWNTFFISAGCVAGQLIVCPMAAYSISRLDWPGARIITGAILVTMMIPYFVVMIPIYKVWDAIGLAGTKWPLILSSLFGNPLYIIILRQFMQGIPRSLFEAATIDGCGEFRLYACIAIPQSVPAITTVGILTFLANWSDYLGPMLYLNKPEDYTLSLGLKAFINEYTIDWPSLMAAAGLFILPVIILFVIFQRKFVEGISTSGLK